LQGQGQQAGVKMALNFLDLEEEFSNLQGARFVVLPVCYEETASYLKGTAAGPGAIIEASGQAELFDERLLFEFHRCGIHTSKSISAKNEDCQEFQEVVYKAARDFGVMGKVVIALGGEHSITPALVRAALERYPDLTVLQIDAHADLRDEYGGSKFSHACVMRRIHDMQIPAVGVGIRSFDKEQYDFIVANNLKIFTPGQIEKDSDWISQVVELVGPKVYITLDIDALDPAFAPGTGTPEPGGLSYRQIAELITAVGRKCRIVGADLVEVIPGICGVVTEFTAARLACKIIAAAQLNGG